MAWYAIYQRVGKAERSDVEIKFGFSYSAFFFTWAWALSKRLYLLALLSFIFGPLTIFSAIYYIIYIIPPPLWVPTGSKTAVSFALNIAPFLLSWVVQVCLGFFGNELHRRMIEKNGYVFRMAACYNRNIVNCYERRTYNLCIISGQGIYSGCISGALLSLTTLWLGIHNLFPIR